MAPLNKPSVTVGLVQINTGFSGYGYFPYVAGLIQGYVERHAREPGRYEFLSPIHKRMPVDDAARHMVRADVVGFGAYVWNFRLSLAIARAVKAARPETLVIFGGPQIPDRAEAFLGEHLFVDVVVHGEGERAFLELLEAGRDGDWSGIAGVSHLGPDGALRHNPRGAWIKDLNEIPSPYLNGAFDALMAEHPDENWIGLWETNRGCPFSCAFCDWGSAVQSKVLRFDMDRLRREIEWFAERGIEFIFTCDANFGILPRDAEIARFVAETKARTGYPVALSVQNTKNATERAYETQTILSDAGLNKGVALSMQSANPEALANAKRGNISLESYAELQHRFTRDGVETFSDLILGLPGETYDSFVEGVSDLIAGGQHNRIQFNNLSILPNAEMGDPAYQARHGFELADAPIINAHGMKEDGEGAIVEVQTLVVGTNTLPAQDWVRVRAFSWMTAFLHFDKILQIPLIAARETTGVSHRTLIESFLAPNAPVLDEVADFMWTFARALQKGGPEFVHAPDWLGIYWPVDEYLYIKLAVEDRLDVFYDEAAQAIARCCEDAGKPMDHALLSDAVALNRAMLSRPGATGEIEVRCGHDVLRFYRGVLAGRPARVEQKPTVYAIDRDAEAWPDIDDWRREVVWYGNKKGAYMYRGVAEKEAI